MMMKLIPLLSSIVALVPSASAWLTAADSQRLYDRMFQTALRGTRYPGSPQQLTMLDAIADSMKVAGLTVDTINYTMYRWDPVWWSVSAWLTNGTEVVFPTTGYWPYSGNTGIKGVTGKAHDAGSYAINEATQTANFSSLNLKGLSQGTIAFFDNPTVTKNYSAPDYALFGTARNDSPSTIPELGNLTNAHWISAKSLNYTLMNQMNVSAVIASWVDISDEQGSLQWLPQQAPPGNQTTNCPAIYVGNSTGEAIRGLIASGQIENITVVLDAPSTADPTYTLIGHVEGTKGANDTILVYTHSDGPSIIEENGPIMLLTMAEYFARNKPGINLDFVMTTGHLSGGKLNESDWMGTRPNLVRNARASFNTEHLGAIEWKDIQTSNGPSWQATGRFEPMWTFANDSSYSNNMRQIYLDSFNGSPETLRMALLDPLIVGGKRSQWYGVGGSSTLGYSNIPTVGIIPQPDYLWSAMIDGGWSKYDHGQAIAQLEALIQAIHTLDSQYMAGTLPARPAQPALA